MDAGRKSIILQKWNEACSLTDFIPFLLCGFIWEEGLFMVMMIARQLISYSRIIGNASRSCVKISGVGVISADRIREAIIMYFFLF